ncbi:MAG TPA: hypothetical protein VFZ55_04910 [Nitrososphaera sp.]
MVAEKEGSTRTADTIADSLLDRGADPIRAVRLDSMLCLSHADISALLSPWNFLLLKKL